MPKIVFDVSIGGALPKRATSGSAGYDLYLPKDFDASSLDSLAKEVKVPIGVKAIIPDGYVGLITARSSLYKAGLNVRLGVIDSDYRGELSVVFSFTKGLGVDWSDLQPGKRFGQLVVVPCLTDAVEGTVNENSTERGSGGFGSTGA